MSSHSDSFVDSGSSPTRSEQTSDIAFEDHYSIVLIRGLSGAGQTWLDENVGDDETQYFGGAVVCEPRYVEAIVLGAIDAGLEVSR